MLDISTITTLNYSAILTKNRNVLYIAAPLLCVLLLPSLQCLSVFRPESNGFPLIRGLPVLGSWEFLYDKAKFMKKNLSRYGGSFVFFILGNKIYAVSSEEATRTFYTHKAVDPNEGRKASQFADVGVDFKHLSDHDKNMKLIEDAAERLNSFKRRYNVCTNSERLKRLVPQCIEAIDQSMQRWGPNGRIDLFDEVYKLVLQTTTYTFGFEEIASSPELLSRVTELFTEIDEGTTPISTLFPWIPSLARKKRTNSSMEIYMICKSIYEERQLKETVKDDGAQLLKDGGDDSNTIIQFALTSFYAGVATTGPRAPWMILFLAMTPLHKERALSELNDFVTKHTGSLLDADSLSISQRLRLIPASAWEDGLPFLENCLDETIRVLSNAVRIRRIMSDDVEVDGKKLELGSFIVTQTELTHNDPEVYSNPDTWDPTRFEREEHKKAPFAFTGWGKGRHPCVGMRFAILEVKMITALFLLQHDLSFEDAAGKPLSTIPRPNKNEVDKQKHLRKRVYVKLNRQISKV